MTITALGAFQSSVTGGLAAITTIRSITTGQTLTIAHNLHFAPAAMNYLAAEAALANATIPEEQAQAQADVDEAAAGFLPTYAILVNELGAVSTHFIAKLVISGIGEHYLVI